MEFSKYSCSLQSDLYQNKLHDLEGLIGGSTFAGCSGMFPCFFMCHNFTENGLLENSGDNEEWRKQKDVGMEGKCLGMICTQWHKIAMCFKRNPDAGFWAPWLVPHPAHTAHTTSWMHLGSQSQVLLLQLSEFILQDIQLQWIMGHSERLVETQWSGTAGICLTLLRSDGNNAQQVILLWQLMLQLVNLGQDHHHMKYTLRIQYHSVKIIYAASRTSLLQSKMRVKNSSHLHLFYRKFAKS